MLMAKRRRSTAAKYRKLKEVPHAKTSSPASAPTSTASSPGPRPLTAASGRCPPCQQRTGRGMSND
jgi:hypothetical protein